jgi:GTP-binding protein YchF
MEIGIVGLPFSGKTTLFSTLTGMDINLTHTGKVETHRGIVKVPDVRLEKLTEIINPKKQTYATIEYVEVGGLESKDVDKKGFDSQFLQVLKTTDALCLVIQAFQEEAVPHPSGSIDPARDIQLVESEFLLSDLSILENRLARLEKQIMQNKTDEAIRERDLLLRCQTQLEQEKPLREVDFTDDEKLQIKGFQFLSAKPLLIVINYAESDISRENELLNPLMKFAEKKNVDVTGLSARVEHEISQLEEEDKKLFMEEMQITQLAMDKLINKSYDLLGLQSFFTMADNECRAWTIRRGTHAQKAAGVIHSDLERGFIRAEVVHFNEFVETGSLAKCREKGTLRLEGKDYILQDGDIMLVRFNV